MTDITELAQSLKAAAPNVTPGPWVVKDYFWLTPESEVFSGEFVECHNGPDAQYLKLLSPENILALVEALEKSQSELAKANGVLDKIKSTSCHVDTSDGSFIPNSLDAWDRPVPQHLPCDFSGNPGASATQYCNGWNDAGGYWLNYVRELESRTVKLLTPEVRNALKAEGLADVLKDAAEYAPLTAWQWETLTKNWHQTFIGLSGSAVGIKWEGE